MQQTTLTDLAGLERKLTIEIPADEVERQVERRLHSFAAELKLPGFRPGKVPMHLIQKNYAHTVRRETLEELIKESYHDAIREHQLTPVDDPKVELVSMQPGQALIYSATIEVYPEVVVRDCSQLEVEKPVAATVTEEDLQRMLEALRKDQANWQEVTDAEYRAGAGDQLIVDYQVRFFAEENGEAKVAVTVDDEEQGVECVLGRGGLWPEFEQVLYGLAVGDERVFTLTFPITHVVKKYAGRSAEFSVAVRKINHPVLPELNDDFATRLSVIGGFAELREIMRERMQVELNEIADSNFRCNLISQFAEHHEVMVPKTLLERELAANRERWVAEGASAELFPQNVMEDELKFVFKLKFLTEQLESQQILKVDDKRVWQRFSEVVPPWLVDNPQIRKECPGVISKIRRQLVHELLVAFLAAQVKTVERELKYWDGVDIYAEAVRVKKMKKEVKFSRKLEKALDKALSVEQPQDQGDDSHA